MRGRLHLDSIVLRLKLGVLPQEKAAARDVPLDLQWQGTVSSGPAVDYAEVCRELERLEGTDYDYLEDLAVDVLNLLTGRFPLGEWRVTVRKPWPPAGLKMESASFTVEGGGNG